MFTEEDILENWSDDTKIDESNIVLEIIKTPSLHSKYLNYYFKSKSEQHKIEKDVSKIIWYKRRYFRGEFGLDELKRFGWAQWNSLKPTATELKLLLDSDKDVAEIKFKLAEAEKMVKCVEYIMTQIKSREFSLKAILEHQKFLAGN